MSITLEGLEEVLESLSNLEDTSGYEAALKKACARVERSAKEKAQLGRGTGELARSITSKVEVKDDDIEGVVFTPLEYAPYVEYGTGLYAEDGKGRKEVPWVYVEGSSKSSNKKTVYPTPADAEAAAAYLNSKGLDAVVTYGRHPAPFMRPALYENKDKILNLIKEGLSND